MSWPLVKLGDIFNITSSKRVLQEDWRKSGIPFYRAREVGILSREGKVDNDLFIDESMYEEYKLKYGVPQEGDILITAVGTLGLTYAVTGSDKFYFKDASVIRLSKKGEVDTKYVQFAIKSTEVQRFIQNSNGATVGTYTINKAKDTEIPLPPLETQKKIAAVLDKADQLRKDCQQIEQELNSLAQSVFIDMFGDPVTNPKGWDSSNLESEMKFLTSGSRGWAKHYDDEGDSIFIRIQNVLKDKFSVNDIQRITPPDSQEAIRTKVQDGDVLLSITADLGRACVIRNIESDSYISQHLALIRVKESSLVPEFLSALLISPAGIGQFTQKNKGGTKAGLNFSDIRSIKVLLPPIELQVQFKKIKDHLDREVTQLKQMAKVYDDLFCSLMQKAFKGELKL